MLTVYKYVIPYLTLGSSFRWILMMAILFHVPPVSCPTLPSSASFWRYSWKSGVASRWIAIFFLLSTSLPSPNNDPAVLTPRTCKGEIMGFLEPAAASAKGGAVEMDTTVLFYDICIFVLRQVF